MKRSQLTFLVILFVSQLILKAQTHYKVIDLGTLGGDGAGTIAYSINDSGQVVGSSYLTNDIFSHGFIWKNGIMADVGNLGGHGSSKATNNIGQVVGSSYTDDPTLGSHAFLWQAGVIMDLDPGGQKSVAEDINDAGIVAGFSFFWIDQFEGTFTFRAVKWSNNSLQDLGIVADSGVYTESTAINNVGQIVGYKYNADSRSYLGSFLWDDGNVVNIDSPLIAVDINDNGEVLCQFTGIEHSGIWQNGAITKDLGEFSAATVNNHTEIVGFKGSGLNSTAMLYMDGTLINLNDVSDTSGGWVLNQATSINNKGEIVGYDFHAGHYRAFLLKPSPNYPVIIVPGIAGTYAADINSDTLWLKNRGAQPDQIQVDPLARVYNDLIKTLENVGYEKDKNLFVVNYDWRLTPGPVDNSIDGHIDGLTGITISDDQFDYGVDYLGWYLKKAADEWRKMYNEELDSVDVIAHSTGGLLTRTYIESNAYGDVYSDSHQLPKIRNFVMIGVPNRGASKAWNPLHDNWIADVAYRFVLSKIINRAYQKIKRGATILGPDYNITQNLIKDSQGKLDSIKFINLYVPTIRYLLATYDFIDSGGGSFTNLNNDPGQRNTLVLDLNNGYDLLSGSNPNQFLDVTKATVIYGNGESTPNEVIRRTDNELLATQSFTEWAPHSTFSPAEWYKDIPAASGGDGTVPLESSVDQFISDNRANLILNSNTDHTGLVSAPDVQEAILKLLNVSYKQQDISTGAGNSWGNIINIISDPVELFITDGLGRKLGYSDSAGAVTEIPNSIWFGDKDGFGYAFNEIVEPLSLEVTGVGEDYYVMVSAEEQSKVGGIVLEGFLPKGEKHTYPIDFITTGIVKTMELIPDKFMLFQNYPNPFNPTTKISYSIPNVGTSLMKFVQLKVYDILGREVTTLVNEVQQPGNYEVTFDGSAFTSGVYFYELKSDSFVQTRKMILLR